MTRHDDGAVLLAIDAGVRETGWAIFRSRRLVTTGVIALLGQRRVDAKVRVAHLVQCLDSLAGYWWPGALVYSQPSGTHWPIPALEMLDTALTEWSERWSLTTYSYTAQEVRLATTGCSNISKPEFVYAVMVKVGLLGQAKTTHEWEAVAVGAYHYQCCPHPMVAAS